MAIGPPYVHECNRTYPFPLVSCIAHLRAKVENGAESSFDGELSNLATGEAGVKIEVVLKDLNMGRAGDVVEEDSDLDGAVGGTVEVVAVATGDVAMESGLAAGVAGVEDLEDVELTAAGLPARALGGTVLESPGDLGVQDPRSRHVHVEAFLPGQGHGELEEVDLALASKAVYKGSVTAHCFRRE